MIKKLFLALLVFSSFFMLAGCSDNTEDDKKDDDIEENEDDKGKEDDNKTDGNEGNTEITETVVEGVKYTLLADGTYKATIEEVTNPNIEILATVNNVNVTVIGKGNLLSDHKKTVKSVKLPDTIKTIEKETFELFEELTTVVMSSSLETLGDYAFNRCLKLENVSLPDTLKSIGTGAFGNCRSITEVVIPNGVTSFGKNVFNGCVLLETLTTPFVGNTTIKFKDFLAVDPLPLLTKIVVTATTIPDETFKNFNLVEEIVLSENTTSIGKRAFLQCNALKKVVNFPQDLKEIKEATFSGCHSLQEIDLPDNLETIEPYAFASCYNIKRVVLPDTLKSIGDDAFSSCFKLVEICNYSDLVIEKESFANGKIGYYARDIYEKSNNITKITLEDNGFITYTITDGLTIVGYVLLGYQGDEKEIVIPEDKYCEINVAAFYNSDIVSVKIPEGIEVIGNDAFYLCKQLEKVELPSTLKTVGSGAFKSCDNLNEVYFNGTLSTLCGIEFWYNPMGYAEFVYLMDDEGNYYELEGDIEIPEDVTIVEKMAIHCNKITSVYVPKTVEELYNDSIKGKSITSIFYEITEEEYIESYMYKYNLTNVSDGWEFYLYSSTQPTGNYLHWHYEDGNRVIWPNNN